MAVKLKQKKYSQWKQLKNTGVKIQDKITLFQINLLDKDTFIIARDSTKELLGQGEGNGLQWIKENGYITDDQFFKDNNPEFDEEDEEE